MAAAVTLAATVPSTVSDQVAASPGDGAWRDPEARQNTTSPSSGVNAGSTARAIPALAIRATIAQPRLSSDASVITHASVVLPTLRGDTGGSSGSSAICATRSAVLTGSP